MSEIWEIWQEPLNEDPRRRLDAPGELGGEGVAGGLVGQALLGGVQLLIRFDWVGMHEPTAIDVCYSGMLLPLMRLAVPHLHSPLRSEVGPPRLLGMTWSIWHSRPGTPQPSSLQNRSRMMMASRKGPVK